MSQSLSQATSEASNKLLFGPLWIGPVPDPEAFLDMERRVFKVEPRPIPGHRGATRTARPRNGFVASFTKAAEKLARKLDTLLKAPFKKLSSITRSSGNSGTRARAATGDDNKERVDSSSNNVEQGMLEERVTFPRVETESTKGTVSGASVRAREGPPSHAIEGRVKSLIRLYENMSVASDSPLGAQLSPVTTYPTLAVCMVDMKQKPLAQVPNGKTRPPLVEKEGSTT